MNCSGSRWKKRRTWRIIIDERLTSAVPKSKCIIGVLQFLFKVNEPEETVSSRRGRKWKKNAETEFQEEPMDWTMLYNFHGREWILRGRERRRRRRIVFSLGGDFFFLLLLDLGSVYRCFFRLRLQIIRTNYFKLNRKSTFKNNIWFYHKILNFYFSDRFTINSL